MLAPQKHAGFTIVELLIVIVVIGILASITVVGYSGFQARAYDTAVQSDFKNVATTLEIYRINHDAYPYDTQLTSMITQDGLQIKLTKSAYGNGFASNVHNFVYCRLAASGPDSFALVAASKSGTVFTYRSSTGKTTSTATWAGATTQTICQDAGINQVISTDRDIFFYNSAWMSYIDG